jgi:chemotaxis protein MotA
VKEKRGRRRGLFGLDVVSILLAPLGLVVVVFAQRVSGLSPHALMQLPAALVVFGGTCGAVLISYRPVEIARAVAAAWRAFRASEDEEGLATSLIDLSRRAHRQGLMAIEADIESIGDPFLRQGLLLAVDHTDSNLVEDLLAADRLAREAADEAPARVFEAAAGYAPTLGILGAVLGLVRAMQDLGTPTALGAGIAAAFAATAYGVGVANLILLPVAGRLREQALRAARRREVITQGVLAIHRRTNPQVVAQGMRAHAMDVPSLTEVPREGARGEGVRGGVMRGRRSMASLPSSRPS